MSSCESSIRGVGVMNFTRARMIPEELSIRRSTEKYHPARARGLTISLRRRFRRGKMGTSTSPSKSLALHRSIADAWFKSKKFPLSLYDRQEFFMQRFHYI